MRLRGASCISSIRTRWNSAPEFAGLFQSGSVPEDQTGHAGELRSTSWAWCGSVEPIEQTQIVFKPEASQLALLGHISRC